MDIAYQNEYSSTADLPFKTYHKQEKSLGHLLNEKRREDQFCDFHFTIHGQKIGAHRVMLASASQYFETMLGGDFLESNNYTCDLSQSFSSTEELDTILSFIYTKQINITPYNIASVLDHATHFILDELGLICAHYLKANLALENAISTWVLADFYQLTNVVSCCESLVLPRFHDFHVHHKPAYEIGKENLIKMIHKGMLNLSTAAAKAKYLCSWAKADLRERGEGIVETLKECKKELSFKFNDSDLSNTEKVMAYLKRIYSPIENSNTSDVLEKNSSVQTLELPLCFSWKKGAPDWENDRGLEIYAYKEIEKQWLKLGSFNLGFYNNERRFLKTFLGIAKGNIVCYGERTIALGNLNTSKFIFRDIPKNAQKKDPGNFFCFSDDVFCLTTVTDDIEDGHNMKALYVLGDSGVWEFIGELPENDNDIHIIRRPVVYVSRHIVYISYHYEKRLSDAFFRILHSFFSVTKEGDSYKIDMCNSLDGGYSRDISDMCLNEDKTKVQLVNMCGNCTGLYCQGLESCVVDFYSCGGDCSKGHVYDIHSDSWEEDAFVAEMLSARDIEPAHSHVEDFQRNVLFGCKLPLRVTPSIYVYTHDGPFHNQLLHRTLKHDKGSNVEDEDRTVQNPEWDPHPGPPVTNVFRCFVTYVNLAYLEKTSVVTRFIPPKRMTESPFHEKVMKANDTLSRIDNDTSSFGGVIEPWDVGDSDSDAESVIDDGVGGRVVNPPYATLFKRLI